jgi:diguanylate cyclase (GGDEF)-like protein
VFNSNGKVLGLEGFITDITERKCFEVQLAHLANHDPLTGLSNRRYFREQLEYHLALAQRYNHCGILLSIDLDDFKDINDTLGHQAGDEILKNLSVLLQEQIRTTDILARLGGDEFAIILPHTSESESQVVTQRIFEALKHHVVVANGQPIQITASIGARSCYVQVKTKRSQLLEHFYTPGGLASPD